MGKDGLGLFIKIGIGMLLAILLVGGIGLLLQ